MNTPNELEEVTLALPDLALGILPKAEAERLMAIVRLNPRLQAELASLRGATNALASATHAVRLSPDRKQSMRDRLMARAKGEEVAQVEHTTDVVITPIDVIADAPATPAIDAAAPVDVVAPSPEPIATPEPVLRLEPNEASVAAPKKAAPPAPARVPVWYRAAAVMALAASALFVLSLFRLRDTLQERNDARVALQEATAETTALNEKLARSDSLVAAMSGASVRVVELASTQKLSPGARMFWDTLTNRWTMVTHDLSPAPEGRTYQLWLVTARSEKISAGTFNTDAKGRAVVQATYALSEADLAAIAITEEPTGGSPQPTGTILVAGAATR